MACIIYYQNLGYDQLPTARKRARLTPSLVGAGAAATTTTTATNTTVFTSTSTTDAPVVLSNPTSGYTSDRLGSLESRTFSTPSKGSYSPPESGGGSGARGARGGLSRSPYFNKQQADSDTIIFTDYNDQVQYGGRKAIGGAPGRTNYAARGGAGTRGRRGRGAASRGAGGARGNKARANALLNDMLGELDPVQCQPAGGFKSANEYGGFSNFENAQVGGEPIIASDSQPLKQISPNTIPLTNTNANPNGRCTSFASASSFQSSPRIYATPDSATLHATLKKYFHFESFRTNQLEAVLATCQGLDTLILMPTGGGKSICYQLPAILSQGVTIVVSPLRSLIEDQVTRLKSLSIPTSALFGETSELEATNITNDLRARNPKHKMLYVTPEKIGASGALTYLFNTMHSNGMLARFVIDEAHCVSMWGSDFRPDYRKLGKLRELWPDVPIMALTATAPPKVREDIYNQLKMNQNTGKTFIQSFNRPNLKFEVRAKSKGCIVDICNLIRKNFERQCGIIYCLSRNDCEQVAQNLRDQGINSAPYHAGLSDQQRKRVFQAWSSGVFQVVCATIAFGMGIDKSDVRFVVHYSVPKSVEGYYQEAGRAGRDGKFAACILYFSKSDLYRMRSMLSKGRSAEDKERDKINLEHMISYVDNKQECRRSILLRYLGERFNSSNCISQFRTACDNCLAQNAKRSSSYHDDDFIDDQHE